MLQRILLVCITFSVPFLVSAQLDLLGISNPEIGITLSPSYPSPGEVVTASLDDYAGGVFGAQINWSYNGEPILDATNERQIQFIASSAGVESIIEAELILAQGGSQIIRESIRPVFMDIIIEPQTRVPDWYLGRALPSLGAQVNATVLLNDGSFINPQNVVYTWRLNKNVLEGGPVRGGNQMAFSTPRGRSMVLSVTAADTAGEVIASRLILVNAVTPELAFYEKHTLYGQRQLPIDGQTSVIGNVLTLKAEPFFLDTRVYNNPDVSEWEINRQSTDNGIQNPYEITLQRGATSGQTLVNFHVRSLQEVLQGAEEAIVVNF